MDRIKDVIHGIFSELKSPAKTQARNLLEKWPAIVGPKLAQQTKPVLKKGVLMIWVEQSALAFELKQRYQEVLLKRVQVAIGDEAIQAIRIYLLNG